MLARHIKCNGLLHAQILGFLCYLKDNWGLKTWMLTVFPASAAILIQLSSRWGQSHW